MVAARTLSGPILLFLVVAGFYWQLVLTNQYQWFDNPDNVYQVIPWFEMQAKAWHSGSFPLWDPHQWLGQSLVGQVQPGVLYPLNWILFLMPLKYGHLNLGYLNWYFVAIHYLAALFSYLLCRDLKCSRFASIFGGACFALCGYFAVVIWAQMLNGATWAPLVFLFFLRVLRGEQPVRNAILCGATYGFAFLSGHHQAPIFIGLALAASWLYCLVTYYRRKEFVLGLKCAALTACFTFLVSAVQMLPAIEYGKRAWRWVGAPSAVDWKTKVPYSSHIDLASAPSELISTIVPVNGLLYPFLGFAVIALAVIAIVAEWRGGRRAITYLMTALAIGAYLYSLGPFTVFHGILYSLVPMLDKARSANLVYVVSSFAIAVLAAFGLDALRTLDNLRSPVFNYISRALVGVGCTLLLFVLLAVSVKLPMAADTNILAMSAVLALLLAGLLNCFRAQQISIRTFNVLIFALALIEWGVPGHRWITRKDQPSLVQKLEEHDDIAGFLQTRPEPVRLTVSDTLIPYNFGDWHGIDQRQGYLASVTTDVFDMVIGHAEARPLESVNYVLGRSAETPAQKEVFTGKSGLKVFHDESAFPRVWTVHSATAGDLNAAIAAGLDQSRREAFINSPAPALETCQGQDLVSVVTHESQAIRITAQMGCTGMLILSDAFFPGWKADVDGSTVPIYRAYGALRGVVVPAGSHLISMRYRPAKFYTGLFLSLIGLLGAGFAAVFPRRFQSTPEPDEPELPSTEDSYSARLIREQEIYHDCVNVHELPAIFGYWADRYLRPKLEPFGFSSPNGMFAKYLADQCGRSSSPNRFVSIGSGNCDMEVDLARSLTAANLRNFKIECVDLNQAMLDRGNQLARDAGLGEHLEFIRADFNEWRPQSKYDGVIACQSLHHVLNLESLFRQIHASLKDDGLFLTSDMIGRNGHARWPEALEIVHEFWRELPAQYRYNHQLKRYEETYDNWDCSSESFEGIRAQDILPLLIQSFEFQLFVAFSNIIMPFVDRAFGHNFNANAEWDRAFIDRVHARDEQEMLAGRIKPTQMIAVMSKYKAGPLRYHAPFTPEFCVRVPD